MKTWCERQGQMEIGVIEHEGQNFAALGATINGRHLTGYTKVRAGSLRGCSPTGCLHCCGTDRTWGGNGGCWRWPAASGS